MQLNLFDKPRKEIQPPPELPSDAQYLLDGFARIGTGRRNRRRRKSYTSTRPLTWAGDSTAPATPPPTVEKHRGHRRDDAPPYIGDEANQTDLYLYYQAMTPDTGIHRPTEDEAEAAMLPPAAATLEDMYFESLTYPQ